MPKTVLSLVSICVFDILLGWLIQGDIHQRKVFMIENSRNHSYFTAGGSVSLTWWMTHRWDHLFLKVPVGHLGHFQNIQFSPSLLDSTGWTQYGHTIRLWCTFTVCEIICQIIYRTIFSKNSMLCSNVLFDIFSVCQVCCKCTSSAV